MKAPPCVRYEIPGFEPIDRYACGGKADIDDVIRDIIERRGPPAGTSVVIKPNLNNDLCALTGNSVDLRVLTALFRALRSKGISDILLAEGMNVGIDRRNIDGFKRLRVDRTAAAHGVRILNVNKTTPVDLALSTSTGRIAKEIAEAEFLISVCKIKTHAEAVFSGALKNWVGISVGRHKRRMHDDLARNIVLVNEAVRPDLAIVDGLVGMAGNGPGDGYPVRLDTILAGRNAAAIDCLACRLVGIAPSSVPAIAAAIERNPALARAEKEIEALVKPIATFEKAPPRSFLARLSDSKALRRLKRRVQPLVSQGPLLSLAYTMKIVQDVYCLEDDSITSIAVTPDGASRFAPVLNDICPAGWDDVQADARIENGATIVSSSSRCLGCLYCYWALPEGSVTLSGAKGFLSRQISRYKSRIETLLRPGAGD